MVLILEAVPYLINTCGHTSGPNLDCAWFWHTADARNILLVLLRLLATMVLSFYAISISDAADSLMSCCHC